MTKRKSTNQNRQHAIHVISIVVLVLAFSGQSFAQWTAVYRNTLELDQANAFDIEELSGVTYLGFATGGAHRVAMIQDEGGLISRADITISANGTLQTAVATRSVATPDDRFDAEGIAYTDAGRNSVFVAYERDKNSNEVIPGVREYNLSTGAILQSVSMPNVWNVNGHTVSNRGFESLTRMLHGKTMWTGNEEALTIDGDRSDETAGTIVRLQKMDVNGNAVSAAGQFAYYVDPVHSTSGPNRSGLADLVALPDGNLMALERSAASAIPALQNRIYQVEYASATDVSSSQFDGGLENETYTTVTKTSVWSGAVNGILGSNMEGLTLGPQLPNGNWTLIGVTDNGGGGNNNNLVSFELIPPTAYGDLDRDGVFGCTDIAALQAEIIAGTHNASFDFTGDGLVDQADQIEWLADAATARGLDAPISRGDADLDGVVTSEDFDAWNANRFAMDAGWCGGDFNHDGITDVSDFNIWHENYQPFATPPVAVPEPQGWWMVLMMLVSVGVLPRLPSARKGRRGRTVVEGPG